MRHKILTVDDSKTVRTIVRKAFKTFDCDVFEASNGVEGLAVAAKTQPVLILLDVTMPVMDGVEMLTKLKSDPALKNIPVMMLTAEGGRDHVLKIAKIGVRDYIVKPFREDTLIEKAGRIIDLKPLTEGGNKPRTILDTVDILVVEDKPAIFQQIEQGLKHTPWRIQGVNSQGEAIDFCGRLTPDLVVISLSLPDESAFALFRTLRNNLKTKFTPLFALVVKTDAAAQAQAQQVGFSAIITKPIDLSELETKMAKAMSLDTSTRYFKTEEDVLILILPENCNSSILAEVGQHIGPKLADAVDAGQSRVIIDLRAVRALNMAIIKLLVQAMQTCRELAMQYMLVGNLQLLAECKSFEETRGWSFLETLEQAKEHLGASAPVPAPAPAPQQLVET